MSIYYYLVCDKHMERCDAGSSAAGGCPLGHSHALSNFCMAHTECSVRITSEYEDSAMEYDEPHEHVPDPVDRARDKEAGLLARAHTAEAEVRKLKKLYGSE